MGEIADMAGVTAEERQAEWDRLAKDEGGQPSPAPDPLAQGLEDPEAPDAGQRGDAPPDRPAADRPAGESTVTDDVWATAPEPLRAAFEAERQARVKAESHISAQNGRLSAETRRALELQAEVETLRKATPEPKDEAPVVDEAARGALREEYPDVAAPLLDVIAGLERQVQQLSDRDASREEQHNAAQALELQRFYAAEEQKLAEQHPDWRETCATPAFATWAQAQPKFVWEALVRNGQGIVDASESARIVQMFKDESGASSTAARREAQLKGSAFPDSRIPAATVNHTTDREAEWKRLDAEDRRKETAGRRATG